MKRILIAALMLTAFVSAANTRETATVALKAAEVAIERNDEKEAGRQLKLYKKAMKRLRFERQLKKAAEALKKIELPTDV